MRIGVLALQGAFAEHRSMLHRLGVESLEIRSLADLQRSMQGLILPGGESTVMGRLLTDLSMLAEMRRQIKGGLPVFGTCAGMILLAQHLENDAASHLSTMNIIARRNAYGRQLGSFQTTADFGSSPGIPMVFIRAPYIAEAGHDVEILATVEERVVAARQGNQLVTAFHPELTDDLTVHRYFLHICLNQSRVS